MKFLNVALLLLLSSAAFGSKCCERCPNGKEKYYSIDRKYNKCGECCMNPKYYWIFKKFESGLEKANSGNPCADLGYPKYETTETHGALMIKMTLDKYSMS